MGSAYRRRLSGSVWTGDGRASYWRTGTDDRRGNRDYRLLGIDDNGFLRLLLPHARFFFLLRGCFLLLFRPLLLHGLALFSFLFSRSVYADPRLTFGCVTGGVGRGRFADDRDAFARVDRELSVSNTEGN
jgi:hypothetical protein